MDWQRDHSLDLADAVRSLGTPDITEVSGTPREVGRAIGESERQRILQGCESISQVETFSRSCPWWLPKFLFPLVASYQARLRFSHTLQRRLPRLADRLLGMAEGAGVEVRLLYLFLALELMTPTLQSENSEAPLGCCTAIGVAPGRAANGESCVLHNLDQIALSQPLISIRDSRGRGELRYVGLTFAPLGGILDGINEAGLCVAYNFSATSFTPQEGVTISCAIEDVLSRCRTVRAALRRLDKIGTSGGAMLMLADATGDLARLETSGRKSVVARADDEAVLYHTNRFRTEDMQAEQISMDATYGEDAPAGLRGCRVLDSAIQRDERLSQLFQSNNPLFQQDLDAVLADHGELDQPGSNTICTHGSYWSTIATVKLFPTSGVMQISSGYACNAAFREIRL